jgi:ribosomal protein S27E
MRSLLFKRVDCHPQRSIACQNCNRALLANYGDRSGLTGADHDIEIAA